MKKIFIVFLTLITVLILTACGTQNTGEAPKEDAPKANTEINNGGDNKQDVVDDEYNAPYEEEKVVVEKIINCDGCVFAYFNAEGEAAKTLGSTLSPSEYTNDVTTLKTGGGKQRHNFFGLILSGNKISRAFACILKDNKVYCIEGSIDGSHHTNNIGILNQIFTSGQCKYISAGHTYTCTDGDYNGDTQTTGYTSLHYETSCVIYGSSGNTGKLICH